MALFKPAQRLLSPSFAPWVVSGKRNFSTPAPSIKVDTDKTGIATLTMQKQPVNSQSLEFLAEFSKTIKELEKDKCRGLILTSACPNVFSAGLELTEMYPYDEKRLPNFWSTFQDTCFSLYACSMPSVAAINGHSPAGGCVLATACEYRVMVGTKYRIGLNETQVGIIAPDWVMMFMKSIIGNRQTELALNNGTLFTTEQALNVGLIDEIVDSQELALESARKFIDRFKKIPTMARTASKLKIRDENISWIKQNKPKDIAAFVNFIKQESVQKALGQYIKSLKKKS